MKSKFDYLIVGAGLFGATFAHQMTAIGKKCLVIDKRRHTGGNTRCEYVKGINVHMYGPHIFHTNSSKIWSYVNSFTEFLPFVYSPMAMNHGKLYNLPFNMNTFYQLWGTQTPSEARLKIQEQLDLHPPSGNRFMDTVEDYALRTVGRDIYEILIREYTYKQWGRTPDYLPAFILRRLPLRFTYDNNYFDDKYQGMPVGGYNPIIERMLEKSIVEVETDYFSDRAYLDHVADRVLFTGQIDAYFDYSEGELEYRSLEFEHKEIAIDNFQGASVINHTGLDTLYTRSIEHKHFAPHIKTDHTVVTFEHSVQWERGMECYYPINDFKNQDLYNKYSKLAEKERKVIFGGRLAEYKYYNMDQVIARALHYSKVEMNIKN